MNAHTTPVPLVPLSAETPPPLPGVVPEILTQDIESDDGALAALIGGIVGGVLLALICIIAVLLWCLSRHKGSYVTNEGDDDDDDDIDNDDDESVGSDIALKSKEPLKVKEEE